MKPATFAYARPRDLDEALRLLAELGDEAKVLAGGQSLGPLLNMRLATPAVLVDVNDVAALDEIGDDGDGVRIGAATRHRTLELDDALRTTQPVLAEAAALIGHPTIRNRGTLGGSLAHADPAAELPAVMVALDAAVEVRSARRRRTMPAAALFDGPYTNTLEPDELLVSVTLVRPARSGAAWVEYAPRRGDYGYVGVCAVVIVADDGRCTAARVVLSGVDVVPFVVPFAAQLVGATLDPAERRSFATSVGEAIEPSSDADASADYKRRLAARLTEQALAVAVHRTGWADG